MSYLGSKAASGAFQAIIAHMPPHDTYIETHVGSGAVLRRKPVASRTIANDINPEVIQAYPLPSGVEVSYLDAVTLLSNFDYSEAGRVLVYCDPPYLHCTRTSRNRYAYEYTEADHKMLLFTLRDLRALGHSVMLSGYPSTLYDEILPDWRSIEFQVMTRGGPRTEKLWMSFEPVAAHWSSYAGINFTDRQRIKRKAERWAKNYAALPPLERQAVLAALLQHGQE